MPILQTGMLRLMVFIGTKSLSTLRDRVGIHIFPWDIPVLLYSAVSTTHIHTYQWGLLYVFAVEEGR